MSHNFEKYCKDYENIENYQKALADNLKGWDCHHRLETHNSDGERRLVDITSDELKALDMYYNRPSSELIFLTKYEHSAYNKGKQRSEEARKKLSEAHKNISEETRKKLSEAQKGKPAWNKGNKLSEETRKKMSEAHKNISEETRKKMSEAQKGNTNAKGMHWFNNGKENKYCYECPDGFVPGKLLIYKEN